MKSFKLKHVEKTYIWGMETWDLSAHKDGQSIIDSGEYKGKLFSEIVGDDFPILIKNIFTYDNLSIQVHPNDEYARIHENDNGKTEMWIIRECEEDSFLYIGFNRELTREEFTQRIENNTVLEVLNKKYIKPGDVIFIPAGLVHAIGKGIRLAEIQQTSNVTYRVYDFGRVGDDGNPRPLHIDKALDVIDFTKYEEQASGDYDILADCEYFRVVKIHLDSSEYIFDCEDDYAVVLCMNSLEKNMPCFAHMENFILCKGDCAFIPPGNKSISLKGIGIFLIIREGKKNA